MDFNVFKDIVVARIPEISGEQLDRFRDMESLYRGWNDKINVISRKDIDELYSHHVLHSLAIAGYIMSCLPRTWQELSEGKGNGVLDIGTGGGFPGIPLAILFPKTEFLLCDSIGKKITVASSVAASLGLENVKTVNARAESLTGKFDFIVSRAVTSLSNFYPWAKGKFSKNIFYLKGGDISGEIEDLTKRFRLSSESIISWDIMPWVGDEFYRDQFVINTPAK